MANWRDIQEQAEKFVIAYKDAKDEDRDAKPFWKDLMTLYGVEARSVGAFEERVKIHGRAGTGKIDYFAPHKFIIEHKSLGKDLDDAYKQVMDYFDALPENIRPRHIIVSDFARIRIYDLEATTEKRMSEFTLEKLPERIRELAFFADKEVREYREEEAIDVKAVRAIGKLHQALKESGYTPEHISPFLTRFVFCCFADDTGIFEKESLSRYLREETKQDGSDIGSHLNSIFSVLNTDYGKRQSAMHSTLADLPYVNGGLFADTLNVVFTSREVREAMLKAMEFNWSEISPAIFGSMFQSVMDEKQRHDLGAHYTSEKNIRKVIDGLFLDELKEELKAAKTNKEKLLALQEKLARITLLDPACGCGNFLVVSYRELRKIENEIISRLYKHGAGKVERGQSVLPMGVEIKSLSKLSVERMYGIEIEAFPAEVAKLSLWLVDHLMNVELGKMFGKPFKKLPLTEAPHIVQGNALRMDWEQVVPKEKLTHILGNPPFLGSRVMEKEQKADLEHVFGKIKKVGELDYVTGWYIKAAEYAQNTTIRVAFVSTNSITQGEQVAILWPHLSDKGVKIRFAHRTFKWSNEAPGKAAVYCVIVGFDLDGKGKRSIYLYDDIRGEPEGKEAKNINPYLVDAPDVFVESRRKPLCDVPPAAFGSMPNDGGSFLFDDEKEKDEFLKREPNAAQFIRPLVSAKEYLQGGQRYCLWLKDASPEQIKSMSEVLRRVEAVRQLRTISTRAATKVLAATPYLWGEDRQPDSEYILIPRVSSENRHYVPLGFFPPRIIAGDTCIIVPSATKYHFGILQSEMHMTWMRAVAGRLKSDYRYSNELVYNNFPWPEKVTGVQKKVVEDAAQEILDVRKKYPTSTLADIYDPNTMPADLLKTHKALDKAVDACYGVKGFKSEPERLEFLFDLYQKLTQEE